MAWDWLKAQEVLHFIKDWVPEIDSATLDTTNQKIVVELNHSFNLTEMSQLWSWAAGHGIPLEMTWFAE